MSSTASKVLSPTWDSVAFITKAQRYVEEMQRHAHDDWRFIFWSSLALELLARGALARISPVLLAEHSNWNPEVRTQINCDYGSAQPPRHDPP
jgi:hypothetical protein